MPAEKTPFDPDDTAPTRERERAAREEHERERREGTQRRVRSVVYAVYVTFAVAFILLSIKSLVEGVFHTDSAPLGTGAANAGEMACADGVRLFEAALDRGMAAGASKRDAESARVAFRAAIAPEWDGGGEERLVASCKSEPRGADAIAALLRLRRAQEGFMGRQVAEIAPVRRDVDAYLSGKSER